MITSRATQGLNMNPLRTLFAGAVFLLIFVACNTCFAFERYKNDAEEDGSNCSECHGNFTDNTSTKGSIFPGDDKHRMHRNGSLMDTDCDLCHTDGDERNAFIGSSNGTANNPGLGCNGCHHGEALRAHHAANGITGCAICHPNDGTPPAENVSPPYYGTVDTRADHPCNDVLASNTNENWTIGDFLGLDNDGNNLYDMADFSCGPPYHIGDILVVSNDLQISWETAGGRSDVLQAAPSLTETFSNVSSVLDIPGVGVVTTNVVEVGSATGSNRFYRIQYAP